MEKEPIPRLVRGPEGEAIVAADPNNKRSDLSYVISDGTTGYTDTDSIVDTRNPYIEMPLSDVAAIAEQSIAELIQEQPDQSTNGRRFGKIAVSMGKITVV